MTSDQTVEVTSPHQCCRVCGKAWENRGLGTWWTDRDNCRWYHCWSCGSDTNWEQYESALYGAGYVQKLWDDERPGLVCNHLHNVEAFMRHTDERGSLLDVGTGHGFSQLAAQAQGWTTTGFDVCAEGRPEGTIVAPEFDARLFGKKFNAVLCREVLEHVANPRGLITELFIVTARGGLCQLTTPRPIDDKLEVRCYQRAHLALWSPEKLSWALTNIGFEILEQELWELGQRYMLCKPG